MNKAALGPDHDRGRVARPFGFALEAVRELAYWLHGFRSIRRMEVNFRNARALRVSAQSTSGEPPNTRGCAVDTMERQALTLIEDEDAVAPVWTFKASVTRPVRH